MPVKLLKVLNSAFGAFNYFFICAESEEADKLEELKKVTAEENARSNARRRHFQAQDSVIVDSIRSNSIEE